MPASAASAPALALQLLGAPRWRVGAGEGALTRLDAAMLALVALSGEVPRDRVAAWLWPDAPLKNANTNLRQHLFKLRQACGHALVETGAMLKLADGVTVDRLAADSATASDAELLGGLDYGDLEALDRWLQQARERLRAERVDALAAQAAQAEAAGALAAAIEATLRLLALAPAQEHGWRRLMRLHYLRGDRSAAIAAFERFELEVCRELGLQPAAETLELLQTIERSAQAQPARGRGPLPVSLVRPPRLVGRDDAWRAVAAAWDAGRAVLLLGEGGIGKSRLMNDLLAAQREAGHPVLEARARPGDAAMPYATLVPLLADALRDCSPPLDPAARRELARLLPALGEAPAAAARQASLWQAIEQLLAGCAPRGLTLLALDDLHFADPASLELLRWLIASPRLASLRWLLAARPDEPEPAAPLLSQWLGDSLRVEPVRLQALSLVQLRELLESLALPALRARDDSDDHWPEALHRHAGGHPFFTLETLKGLVLQNEPTAATMPLPPVAGAMIERRVARLPALPARLLQLLALAPGLLDQPLAARLLEVDIDALAAAWGELEAAQLSRGAQPVHDLVREQVLAAWPAAARAPVAAALARALAARAAAVAPTRLAAVPTSRLAALWLEAQAWPEAAAALETAARNAGRAGRLAEQVALYERAAAAWRQAQQYGPAFDAELQAWNGTLMLRGSQAVLDGTEALLVRADTAERRAGVLTLRANALLNEARFDDALASSQAALRDARPGSVVALGAATLHGRALALTGHADEATRVLEAACRSADEAGDDAQALAAHGAFAHALQVAQRVREAAQHQRLARELALRLGDATEVAQASCNLATLQTLVSDAQTALHTARDADERLTALGAGDAHWVYNRITLARCAAHVGRFDEALAALDSVHASAEAVGASMATMMRVIRFGIELSLGIADRSSLPDPDPAWSPLSRAGLLLGHHRYLRDYGGSDAARAEVERRLQQLAQAHPFLADDPVLAREWCRIGPPPERAARLLALEEQARAQGALPLARSLRLTRIDRLLECDPARAGREAQGLRPTLADGLHPAHFVPAAWSSLAAALRAIGDQAAADEAAARAHRWLEEARLPPSVDRGSFLQHHARRIPGLR